MRIDVDGSGQTLGGSFLTFPPYDHSKYSCGFQRAASGKPLPIQQFRVRVGLNLPPMERQRTLLELDGEFGTDANLNGAFWNGYHVLAKGTAANWRKTLPRLLPTGRCC